MTPTSNLIEIDGRPYTLTFNFTTARTAEKEIGQPLTKLLQKPDEIGMDAMSAIWWASLQRGHRMTREGADALIDIAGLEPVAKWVAEGLTGYFGGGKKAPDDSGDADGDAGKVKTRKAKA